MRNTRPLDRFFRGFAGILILELSAFWLAGAAQWLAFVGALVILLTAISGFCPLYRLAGLQPSTASAASPINAKKIAAWIILCLTLVGGSYASHIASRKIFLEDFNSMNDAYKQTLFLTGKAERESAKTHYAKLVPALAEFKDKYTRYQPVALRNDIRLADDFRQVSDIVTGVGSLVKDGDLREAHLVLEKVRPIFQEMFKRNGFSLLAVALVDFHDAMELMLNAANYKDSAKLVALYPTVSDKLRAVEAEAKDSEVQAIRNNLDALESAARSAQQDALPALSEKLKSSFVKVYLQRG